jgi:hypothetical protein
MPHMSLREKLRKPDWLGEMQAVLVTGLVITGLGIALSAAWTISGDKPVSVTVPAQALPGVPGSVGGLTASVTIASTAAVEVQIQDPTVHQRISDALTGLPTALLVLVLLAMLLRIVRRARRADPFTAAAVRQLRILAVIVLAGGVLVSTVETIATLDLVTTLTNREASADVKLPAHWVLAGFGLLAIAEVVRRGTAMRTELEAVI